MVIYCVAIGCKNEQDKRKISFHGFPFKRPEVLNLWIKAVRRENWTPYKTSKLCGEHFHPFDYIIKQGCTTKLLKPDAVPSVFSYPAHLLPKIATPRRKIKKLAESVDVHNNYVINDSATSMDIIDLSSTSASSSQVRKMINRETQTDSNKMNILLQRKVKTLKQKVKRRDVKITNMKDVINEISKSGHSNENLDELNEELTFHPKGKLTR
ncbi:unnamed protein product [Psylliodes chrysocephalus]|uniref:THAP-type domain-containing protein n=1 Tax=Psylliodes chrysocephalus TaxID=3402493 RepID=A0A9P0CYQ0_9CUCU|nr:unnamed protein product [Psylliodes chrysocephala]